MHLALQSWTFVGLDLRILSFISELIAATYGHPQLRVGNMYTEGNSIEVNAYLTIISFQNYLANQIRYDKVLRVE